ncbi:50S ribosomal protein L13 [archaeon]|jgi:large subunit ribosomal protein L13|nr:50S ribosomal protein L13 [archaeon]MBT4373072.1 50S ribosomal protein L13 [archaeon]MBT4531417.1 50S ribosomal protein L13 [archaeon]MBT7001405.1 50S ribosomal protein L13 [archaeon]MBT7282109.1 50S ribosomal protein L13 [archaeon]
MKILDGTNAVMGRLASHVAKEALKGEEIIVVNCKEVVVTGNRKMNETKLLERRGRVGTAQKGPKHHRSSEKMVKRVIRNMLPNYRNGRGREAWKRIKCYDLVPAELKDKKMIKMAKDKIGKHTKVEALLSYNG